MNGKLSVIGAGNVGATLAQLAAEEGLSEIVLFDIVDGMPQGKALDMAQACALWGSSSKVLGTSDYSLTEGSDVVVITAGLARKPGMSRDDLLHANADIMDKVTAEVARLSPDAILVIVTNPMDVMAGIALGVSGFKPERVVGMGGVLDAARFRAFVSMELGVSVRDVEALVLGGHGDQMVPLPRYTTVRGVPITELLPAERVSALIERTRNGGAEIVSMLRTGSAYYAPAASALEMTRAVLLDEKRMLPCSVYLRGEFGISDTYAGVPAVLGREGVERVVELELTDGERRLLHASADAVNALVRKLRH